MLISFVIPHHGRIDMLQKTLQSIAMQACDLTQIEVLIVSQNDSQSIDHLIENQPFSVSILYAEPSDTISRLRNIGVEKSIGQYLAFLDADIFLSENWIETMQVLLNESGQRRVIVSAVQVEGENAPPLEIIRTEISNAQVDCNVDFLPGRNLFVRREDFDKIGGFPEHLVTCEDYYFTDMASKYGALYYSTMASYIHLGEDKDFLQMYKKEIWRGQSNWLSIKGRNVPLSEYPSFLSPIWITFFIVLSLFSLLFGCLSVAVWAAVFGLLPLLIYVVRLYSLSKGRVSLLYIVKFYLFYFPARAYGTIVGLFKSIDFKNA